jgi:hypothetical protein
VKVFGKDRLLSDLTAVDFDKLRQEFAKTHGLEPLSALNLDGGWINFPRPKTGVARRAKLWPETVEALKAAIAVRPAPRDETLHAPHAGDMASIYRQFVEDERLEAVAKHVHNWLWPAQESPKTAKGARRKKKPAANRQIWRQRGASLAALASDAASIE